MPFDYSAFSHHQWAGVADLHSGLVLEPGVHSFPGGRADTPIDVLVEGCLAELPADRGLPVFLTAATGDRAGTTGPYFSGRQMAAGLGAPCISISDPTLGLDPDLRLGWYTGKPLEHRQDDLVRIVNHLAVQTRRPLILVGGSGAGFASILLAGRCQQSALVWNPQTDILAYDPPAVDEYLGVVLGEVASDREDSRRELEAGGIQTTVLERELPQRLYYLQNASDWHLKRHAAPFIDHFGLESKGRGTYTRGLSTVVKVGAFGQGHSTPSRRVLMSGISTLMEGLEPWGAFRRQLGQGMFDGEDYSTMPGDLRHRSADLGKMLELRAAEAEGRATIQLGWPEGVSVMGSSAEFTLWDASDVVTTSPRRPVTGWTTLVDRRPTHVTCVIRDGLEHIVANASASFV